MGSIELKGKSFLTLLDFSPEEIAFMLDSAAEFKKLKKEGKSHRIHEGKNVALIFEKTSTRTRCAFEVAAADLGMHPVYLDPKGSQIGKKESIRDTAKVLGRMFDGIEYRGFGQERVEELAKESGVPVWNGLTDQFHPTQILATLLTIKEHFGKLKGIKLCFMGDARFNMGVSMMIGCAKMGLDYIACAPEKYFPPLSMVEKCKKIAEENGGSITLETDVMKATKGVDVIYTDVWVSMGEKEEVWKERIEDLLPYQVNSTLMENGGEDTIFLHCLPSFHDLETEIGLDIYKKYGLKEMEVTDKVFRSPQSLVFEEAENRMHTIKAVMALTL
ncbi:MAG: ornithine carbamoyltransferase [Candidatus Ornithospirochaeta sp.]|nr:ornithine carbamoyltransferase [Sphaerochaetaceae bacterium]MDY5522553.1 ornithine carbamoyltransferase [Candidatus Ornithospirochaeta sp.]